MSGDPAGEEDAEGVASAPTPLRRWDSYKSLEEAPRRSGRLEGEGLGRVAGGREAEDVSRCGLVGRPRSLGAADGTCRIESLRRGHRTCARCPSDRACARFPAAPTVLCGYSVTVSRRSPLARSSLGAPEGAPTRRVEPLDARGWRVAAVQALFGRSRPAGGREPRETRRVGRRRARAAAWRRKRRVHSLHHLLSPRRTCVACGALPAHP